MAEIYLDFDKAINTEQLSAEIGNVLIAVVDQKLRFIGDITEKQALDGLNKHIPVIEPEPTIEQKLASVGLSLNDLKIALGI